MSKRTPIERFFAKVNADAPGGCWEWTGFRSESGYGLFVVVRGSRVRAHRFAYETFNGPIPDGYQVDHLCHVPKDCGMLEDCPHRRCVNPEHLAAVTPRENVMRTNSFAPQRAAQTHCMSGHEFTPENTRIRTNGCRACRECGRINSRRWNTRTRAKIKQEKAGAGAE